MDYNDVPLFACVVEKGSFSSAALALGLQKSTVSRNVARLEDDLGVRLLQRTTRKIALTEAGKAFYERVRSAVSGLNEAASAAQDLGGEPRGIVRVTAPPDADSDSMGIAAALTRFVELHPKIHVELSLGTRRVDLVAEGFDLAIRAGTLRDSSLIARKVGTTSFALFAAPKYLARRGTPKTLTELTRHDCIVFRGHGGRATWNLSGPNGPESVEVSGPISADDLSFMTRLAVASLGITLLPLSLAREPAQKGALQMILRGYGIDGAGLHVVLPSATFVPTRVALLRDFLVDYLSKELAHVHSECANERRGTPSKDGGGSVPNLADRKNAARRRRGLK